MNTRVKQIERTAKVAAKLAGLITVSALATGCSLLPFGRSTPKDSVSLRPQLHEVSPKSEPDCLAADGPGSSSPESSSDVASAAPAEAKQSPACTTCACGGAGNTAPVAQAELKPAAPQLDPAEAELQRLMDGNKRFVEGEAENVYQWPQRPGEERTRRPPTAMVVACSDWQILPESAFDTKSGELFVVRIAGNAAADDAVVESAKFAIQQYSIPLIVVLGHEECSAIKAGLVLDDASEGRAASEKISGQSGEADDHANDSAHTHAGAMSDDAARHLDGVVHANVDEMVSHLRRADSMLRRRIDAGRLDVVGAYYDETNGQITLQPEERAAEAQFVETPRH